MLNSGSQPSDKQNNIKNSKATYTVRQMVCVSLQENSYFKNLSYISGLS